MACTPAAIAPVFTVIGLTPVATWAPKKYELGNTLDIDLNTVIHLTRAGSATAITRPNTLSRRSLRWVGMGRDDINAAILYIKTYRGWKHYFDDHFGDRYSIYFQGSAGITEDAREKGFALTLTLLGDF